MRPKRTTVAVVTGTRAEFGLLLPVMRAIRAHKRLRLQVVAAGAHFLAPARTISEVEAAFPIAARVPMQRPGHSTRADDARALGRGVEGFARAFTRLKPDWVVVLGDRIEAFAAASAASIAGIAVAHIHGGDRAEGIADEAMRHAITKLAHLHLAATKQSADRIRKMGEPPKHVHVVGSPAIDGLLRTKPMTDQQARRLGDPEIVLLHHPAGLEPYFEGEVAKMLLWALDKSTKGNVLILAPNHDPGRAEILRVFQARCKDTGRFRLAHHLPRESFIALLRRVARKHGGFLIGNSSAGLIEAAALGVRVVNVGTRQAGREQGSNVVDLVLPYPDELPMLLRRLRRVPAGRLKSHPFGDGHSGPRIARLLASTDPHDPALLRKRNTY